MDNNTEQLNELLTNNSDQSGFYSIISDFNVEAFDDQIFPILYSLYRRKKLRKDLVYLGLLSKQNFELLNKFLAYDETIHQFNITDSVSLYDYCVYRQEHWLKPLIVNYTKYHQQILIDNPITANKFLLLKLIELTNTQTIDIDKIANILPNIESETLDSFGQFYWNETDRLVRISEFCATLNLETDRNCVFRNAVRKSLLDTLSTHCDLDDSTKKDAILQKLDEYEHVSLYTFLGFRILTDLINVLSGKVSIENFYAFIDELKNELLKLEVRPQLQIELLENLFTLLFVDDPFVCEEKDIRLILYILKQVMDVLDVKNKFAKDIDGHGRFVELKRHLADALWRLELITDVKCDKKLSENLLHYMTSSAETLIYLCLKKSNFDRADQVVKIFSLENTEIFYDIINSYKLDELRTTLKNNFRLKALSQDSNISTFDPIKPLDLIISKYIQKIPVNIGESSTIANENFRNIFDLALTLPCTRDDCQVLVDLAQKIGRLEDESREVANFHQRITQIFQSTCRTTDINLMDLLHKTGTFDLIDYQRNERFWNNLCVLYEQLCKQLKADDEAGVFNRHHPSHATFLELDRICTDYAQSDVSYLKKIYNYLCAFSKVLYIQGDNSDVISDGKNTSYFKLLHYNRSELMGELLFKRQLEPRDFERYFRCLKLDFLYHLVGNCFPTINLHALDNVTIEELYHDNMLYIPNPALMKYIQKRNWLLAFILAEMYRIKDQRMDITEIRLQTFFNYLNLPKIEHLKLLYDDNEILAALQNCISAEKVRAYFKQQIVAYHLRSISFVECKEVDEKINDVCDWCKLFNIIESVPENQLRKKDELDLLRDSVLSNLVGDAEEKTYHKYIYLIRNREIRTETFFKNFRRWSGDFCLDVIRSEMTGFIYQDDEVLKEMIGWIPRIELCEDLKCILDVKIWYEALEQTIDRPSDVLSKLIESDDVDIVLRFLKIITVEKQVLRSINAAYIRRIISVRVPFGKIEKLFEKLPFDQIIDVCINLLATLTKLECLQFVIDYLKRCTPDDQNLKNVQLSLRMLGVFSSFERENLYPLINEPLDIIEVLIMNTKLEKLSKVLTIIADQRENVGLETGGVIETERIDNLLRLYAGKSLDFRVITQSNTKLQKTSECILMQSLDSFNLSGEAKRRFVMPDNPPVKEKWVPGDEAFECMCCLRVTFSMFNRRHHCRRCGRVVCYNCSTKRMLVPTYGDIMVRVCIDCYHQTNGMDLDKSEMPSIRSLNHEVWLLNDDVNHNKIIREEFSYEHAPSVSLCLTIMKHHSRTTDYPKFLLERCDDLVKLLQPKSDAIAEIDYDLVLKMLKSLAMAAKMASLECNYNDGISLADRIVSQAELLHLLSEKGCLNLMSSTIRTTPYVDVMLLRRLRDKLIQREQWNLALELSTKAGMEASGIFAAWGKSYLKAGHFLKAREKFKRCLITSCDRISDLNRSCDSSSIASNISHSSDCEMKKDPVLLYEIIHILESQTMPIRLQPQECRDTDPICILNKIRNLNDVIDGVYPKSANSASEQSQLQPRIEKIFYDECVYYLEKYGSHYSLIDFYIRYGQMQDALRHIIEYKLSGDTFTEIYMQCLKRGIVGTLQEALVKIDSTLGIWKAYLRGVCCYLESNAIYNSLYQLQVFMGDYMRAAMTCIRFYQDNAKSFVEMSSNVGHLERAEQHLREIIEEEQWVELGAVPKKVLITPNDSFENGESKIPSGFWMKANGRNVRKHLATIKRQMEIVDFLVKLENNGDRLMDLADELGQDVEKYTSKVPVLFGSRSERECLAILCLLSDEFMNKGFEFALSVINEFDLKPIRVFRMAAKHLAKLEKYTAIMHLVNCIKSAGLNDTNTSNMLDEMLMSAINTLIKKDVPGSKVEDLIKLIKDRSIKITAYIEAKQLKTAYYLAVKYKRMGDLRRIQREAELFNQQQIKALCQKILQNSTNFK